MTTSSIRRERIDGCIDLLTIDRPPVNALPPLDWSTALDEIKASSADTDVRAVVISGGTGRFCAGADIRALTNADPSADRAEMLTVVARLAAEIHAHRAPVIAAIDGPAHGGGLELALACDIRIASPTASFAAAGVNMGLMASVRSLVDSVGDTRARRMLLTADRFGTDDALGWGLVTDVHESPTDAAMEMARRISTKAPLAVETTKDAVNKVSVLDAAAHDRLMSEGFAQLSTSDDHAEAIAAFLEKRSGNFNRR
jgi:enoyl-CoA hydratase/carnithine racemase